MSREISVVRMGHELVTPGELIDLPIDHTDQIISAEVEEGGKIRVVWAVWDYRKEDE